ncbi:hypothetical protein QWJ38_16465 [Pelomonas sp. PFR6]|uniref:Uncharacterized protein n=1 Tax=Roseateles violae TaxID=3058042 RepID=A0ABT8DXZ3_9BURK|nr:hypothetical protein [Pelomonas sp. PFR6]MDN3921884.1 hypothetical protein [Pelomonas sp. PFR6]
MDIVTIIAPHSSTWVMDSLAAAAWGWAFMRCNVAKSGFFCRGGALGLGFGHLFGFLGGRGRRLGRDAAGVGGRGDVFHLRQDAALLDPQHRPLEHLHVQQRIAGQQQEAGLAAGLEAAQLPLRIERAGGVDGGDAQQLGIAEHGQAQQIAQFQLHGAGEHVGAQQQRHAGRLQRLQIAPLHLAQRLHLLGGGLEQAGGGGGGDDGGLVARRQGDRLRAQLVALRRVAQMIEIAGQMGDLVDAGAHGRIEIGRAVDMGADAQTRLVRLADDGGGRLRAQAQLSAQLGPRAQLGPLAVAEHDLHPVGLARRHQRPFLLQLLGLVDEDQRLVGNVLQARLGRTRGGGQQAGQRLAIAGGDAGAGEQHVGAGLAVQARPHGGHLGRVGAQHRGVEHAVLQIALGVVRHAPVVLQVVVVRLGQRRDQELALQVHAAVDALGFLRAEDAVGDIERAALEGLSVEPLRVAQLQRQRRAGLERFRGGLGPGRREKQAAEQDGERKAHRGRGGQAGKAGAHATPLCRQRL